MLLTILDISGAVPAFACGILLIASLRFFGSITSKQRDLNYLLITAPAILAYLFMGLVMSKWFNAQGTFEAGCVWGLFDGTVGSRIAIFSNAKKGLRENEIKALESCHVIIRMIIIGGCVAILGRFIRQIFT